MIPMTLDQGRDGQVLAIKELGNGFGSRRKLYELGIMPGERITVLKVSQLGGPILVAVKGTEVAIGRGIAHDIEVEDLSSGPEK